MKTLLLLPVSMLVFSWGAYAQFTPCESVEYSYDAKGNQVLRKPWGTCKQGRDFESREGANLHLYPNPATEATTIELLGNAADSAVVRVMLFDLSGELLLQRQSIGNRLVRLELTGLAQGVYMVQVQVGENDSKGFRLVKL